MRIAGALLFLTAAASASAAPKTPLTVTRVDPPSWFAGHSVNPVRLLLHGTELTGAAITTAGSGVKLGAPKVSASGTWMFVDATIDPAAAPGPRMLEVKKGGVVAKVPFSVEAPLTRAGRFQGFSPDDVIYLIMPDRF